MTDQEFLHIFEHHLQVGGTRRTEIIAETATHLEEEKNLGDPKAMAQDFNRLHFGRFGTFEWLLIRAFGLPLLDWWITGLNDPVLYHHGSKPLAYTLLTISLFVHLLAVANIFVSAHALAHMDRRWKKAGWWSLVTFLFYIFLMAYYVLKYPAQPGSLTHPALDFLWNLGSATLNVVIFIPAFFITWPKRPTRWFEKIGFAALIGVVTYFIWISLDYIFSGFFTYLYTYPWVLRTFPGGLHGWDIGIIIAAAGVFFLHEVRFSIRRKK